jgi:hypothetical protein
MSLLQKIRRALTPMRKALIDSVLLGTLLVIILALAGTDIPFANTWIVIPIYGGIYLIASVLRLRQAAHHVLADDRDPAVRELSSSRTLNAVGLWKGDSDGGSLLR